MAGLENLFAAEPTLPNVQTTKLPDDPQQWAEVITTRLREQYPEVTRLPLTVEYRKKDPQSGTAIGAVQVSDPGTGRSLFVPIIVKKFELYPLDIWMEAKTQEVHPLTNDTFKEEFFATSMSDGLDQRPFDAAGQYFNDPSLWTTNYPPLQGRYSYASAGFEILDQISDTITPEQVEAFRKILEKHAYVIPKFKAMKKAANALEAVTKIAQMQRSKVHTNDFGISASKLIPVGAAYVKREGYDKYSVISMADQLFDISASEYMNREDCAKFLSKIYPKPWDFLHEVDQEGEKMIIMKKAPEKGVFLYDDIRPNAEAANEFAVYDVRNKAGMHVLGVVIPYVVDFSGKKVNQKLFLSEQHSCMQSGIAGVKRENSDHFLKMFRHPRAARVGQTGTFIFIDDGKAVATVPVTIKAIEEHGPITAITLDGQKIKIKRSYSDDAMSEPVGPAMKKKPNFLDAHGMVEVRPKEYIIPRRMTWYPMEGFQDVTATPDEYIKEASAEKLELDPLVIRWTGIVYDVSGAGMEKVSLDERRTKLLLATRGATLDKIAQIIKKAREHGKAKVHGTLPLRKKADIIKYAQEIYADLEKICSGLRSDLVKEAAEIDDAMTVDALLSLGFINPENLAKFVSYRPVLVKVLDYLAELTLAARLGLKDLTESALVTAMGRLQEVVEGLKKVENGLKKPSIKTAAAKAAPGIMQTLSKELTPRTPEGRKFVAGAGRFARRAAPIAVGGYIAGKALGHDKQGAATCPACKKKGCECGGKCSCCKEHAKKLSGKGVAEGIYTAEKKAAAAKEKPNAMVQAEQAQGPGAPMGALPPGMPGVSAHSKAHSGNPKGENPFADGMADGEMGTHMYIDKWRRDAKAMLQYMNGKRISEQNKATSGMALGIPPKGAPKPKQPGAAGGTKK